MFLRDLFESNSDEVETTEDAETQRSVNPALDYFGAADETDVHTPKMTLRTINGMKKVMQAKHAEAEQRKDLMAIMYAAPAEDDM